MWSDHNGVRIAAIEAEDLEGLEQESKQEESKQEEDLEEIQGDSDFEDISDEMLIQFVEEYNSQNQTKI